MPWLLGIAKANEIFYAKASGVGNKVVYLGSKTGATAFMARPWPLRFRRRRGGKASAVQVGDPFTEKLLLEACLEFDADRAVIAIQDMARRALPRLAWKWAPRGISGSPSISIRCPARDRHDRL